MGSNIIDVDDEGIVAKETQVRLSDEKLRGMLSKIYERALGDLGRMALRKLYGVLLTVFGTLLVALMTSDFHALGKLGAEQVTLIAWVICVASGVVGLGVLIYSAAKKSALDLKARDKAVEDIFSECVGH